MNRDIVRKIKKKENKNEVEWALISYQKTLFIINEILVQESKYNLSSEEAINDIRRVLKENL